MSSPNDASNALSLRLEEGQLRSDNKFQMNRQKSTNFGLVVVTMLAIERSVTLICNNLCVDGRLKQLDLLEALECGLLELTESGKDDVIAFPPTAIQRLDQLNIPPKPSPEHLHVWIGVKNDTTNAE
jgi:hypothetical protein